MGAKHSGPERKLPLLNAENEAFWTGGRHGALMIRRCTQCGLYQHPPLPICSACRTETVLPTAVLQRPSLSMVRPPETATSKMRSWVLPPLSVEILLPASRMPRS